MGRDFTLHVVDEKSLARFGARFLHGLHRDFAFDREYDGDDMIATVKLLIAKDPETGARALAELALLYVSTEAPHIYSRGVALSLWNAEAMGVELPAKWLGGVETRLPNIIAAYPKIARLMPTPFDADCRVGPMVSARDVPALLAVVERAVSAMAQRARAPYRGLVDVLRVAASRGLAYWEGSELDVAQANTEWLAPVRPPAHRTAPSPLTSPLARPLAIAGTRMLVGEHFVLHELDTGSFPPGVITYEDMQVTTAAFTPWGTEFVRMATDRTQRPFKFSYYELPGRTPLAFEPPWAIGLALPMGDALLLFPQPTTQERAGLRPLVMRSGGGLEPLAVPETAASPQLACGAVPFGDGTMLVIWDGVPYRWDGEAAPIALGGALGAPDDPCAAATLSDGSIVGGFARKLVRIDREGTQTIVLPLDNVMAVTCGPDDVLVISEGENPEDDALKLWWPETREVTSVQRSDFSIDDRPTFTYYDPISELVVVARPGAWHAVPWFALAELRRVSEEAFVENRARLVARASR